jgi:HlyD family secretion protein
MNKRIAVGALAAVLLAVLAGWLWYRHSASLEQGALTLLGNVDIRQVSLAFQDSERIQAMRVDEGAKVKAGEVLARLDTRTLELQAAQARTEIAVREQALLRLRNGSRPEEIAQAQARAGAARVDVQLAEQDFKRVQDAAQETQGRAVSRQERDRVAAQLQAARAKLDDQTQALRLAKAWSAPGRHRSGLGSAAIHSRCLGLAGTPHLAGRVEGTQRCRRPFAAGRAG